jgi:predicted secreted protein
MLATLSFSGGIKVDSIVARGDTLRIKGITVFGDSVVALGVNFLRELNDKLPLHGKADSAGIADTVKNLPSNVVYTDNTQTIAGTKTFTANNEFSAKLKTNKLYFRSQPANDYFWDIALGEKSTLFTDGAMKLMQNCYYNSGWKTRAASTGASALFLNDGAFGVYIGSQTSANADMLGAYAIFCDASARTAIGKTSFVSSDNKLEVEGNVYVNGNITATGLTASQIVETDASKKLVSAAKGTAYNKSFAGSGSATTVARSDHGHTEYATYKDSSFVYTLSGVEGAVYDTAKYTKVGNLITIRFRTLFGTSSTTGMSIKGIPVGIRPKATDYLNGAGLLVGVCAAVASGSVYFPTEVVYMGGDSLMVMKNDFSIGVNKGLGYRFNVTYLIED